ncbi:MAG: hypothetical protein AB7O96_01850 [Pseudobdellovibrionaceae bacterium]
MELPKYSRWEHERKFLVHRDMISRFSGKSCWLIEDKYFEVGRLRLRAITEFPSGRQTFKLCKKFASDSAYSAPMVNIYLSQEEYEGLKAMPGRALAKHRYHDDFQGHKFAVDFFLGDLSNLAMCEVECESESELMTVEWPDYAMVEVTTNPFFTGGFLCRVNCASLNEKLQRTFPKLT